MFSIFSMFSVFSQLPLHDLPSRMAGWNNLWSPGWVYSKEYYSVNSQVCCSFGNVSSQNPLPTHSLKAHIGWILKNQVQRQRVRQTIWQTHYMPYIFNPVDSSASSMIIVDVEYITLVNWATSINPSKKRAKSLLECVIVFFNFVSFTSFFAYDLFAKLLLENLRNISHFGAAPWIYFAEDFESWPTRSFSIIKMFIQGTSPSPQAWGRCQNI